MDHVEDARERRFGPQPRPELLKLAEDCGAVITGKPDGSESITVVFTIPAWRAFDTMLATRPALPGMPHPAVRMTEERAARMDVPACIYTEQQMRDYARLYVSLCPPVR